MSFKRGESQSTIRPHVRNGPKADVAKDNTKVCFVRNPTFFMTTLGSQWG